MRNEMPNEQIAGEQRDEQIGTEYVVLVDDRGMPIGQAEKLMAHQQGLAHLAFSIVIVDDVSQPRYVLLQKRHDGKYHSGGLWSNTCCSHPRVHETLSDAVHRRLLEEMGFSVPLNCVGQIHYCLDVGHACTENEWTHVYIGQKNTNDLIAANDTEVSDWKWVAIHDLMADVAQYPKRYTAWFPCILDVCLPSFQLDSLAVKNN